MPITLVQFSNVTNLLLMSHSNLDMLNFVCMFLPKLDKYVISKYTLPFKRINVIKNIAIECLSFMLNSKDEYKVEYLWCILFACSQSCQDVYDIMERLNSQKSTDRTSNLKYMLSIMTPELVLDLKSPSGMPFCGQINGHSWFYQVIESHQFSIIQTELSQKYVKQNQSGKFNERTSNAVDCISNMRRFNSNNKFPNTFYSIHFHQVLYAFSICCQDVYDIVNDIAENKNENISSNLIFLNSELLSKELYIALMKIKSPKESPFTGNINGRPWLSRVIESQQTPILSYIFDEMRVDVAKVINSTESGCQDISKTLITFLLEKSDNQRMLRRDFFMILTKEKDKSDAISYVKHNSNDTSNVSLKAVQEIQDLFDFTAIQKFKIMLLLIITFVLGASTYFLDVGAD